MIDPGHLVSHRPPILISIPSRGRPEHLKRLVEFLAETKSKSTTVVVVLNGPKQQFLDLCYSGIYFVHIGDIPTIPIAVNFGWYALRRPETILVKLDNDILPPHGWEREVIIKSGVADLGGFLSANEYKQTQPFWLRGHRMRRPHQSHTWGIPFIYGGFLWLSPQIAPLLQYEDERFVRSDDGDLGERVSRVPGATMGYSCDLFGTHLSPGPEGSTEPHELLTEMYQACDLLIKALPLRGLSQDTVWSSCLSPQEAQRIVMNGGVLPKDIELEACRLLLARLKDAFAIVGRKHLVDHIFERI